MGRFPFGPTKRPKTLYGDIGKIEETPWDPIWISSVITRNLRLA